ncbi:glycosyltransferase family 4 protein [Parabacteroides sp.]
MNILILNTSEFAGGAAVAANRLAKALNQSGLDVFMLVRERQSEDFKVGSLNNTLIRKKLNYLRFIWERIIIFLCNGFSKKKLFQVSIANTGTDISKHPLVQKADIIHLHWINQGFLSLSDINKLIATGKPIVWTMHDLWTSTAICHYPGECEKYTTGCSRCPMLEPNLIFDLAASVFKKKALIRMSDITFVGCSHWITEEARKSALIKDANFVSIPNPIDTTVFKFEDKNIARKYFNLPDDKYLLLFAAAKLSDIRKGAAYLIEACNILKYEYQNRIEIVLMGNSSEELISKIPFRVNSLGYISEQEAMVMAYNCADMFIIPSLEDNLPNTIMESMACGTPCVGFDTGGIPEMIDHQVNGYVAKYKDAADLANGIQWILENKQRAGLTEACLNKVQSCYSERIIADRYKSLYETLCKQQEKK